MNICANSLQLSYLVRRALSKNKDILQHDPPVVPLQCPTEALHHCFPQHHFDVVHMRTLLGLSQVESFPVFFAAFDRRNSLDHANDPLMGILELIWVARCNAQSEATAAMPQLPVHESCPLPRPGGWVLLRHARNEGVAGHFQLGLHQWASADLDCDHGVLLCFV